MIRLEMYTDARLKGCLVAVGRHFGGVQYVDKQIDALDAKGHTQVCKDVMCEITGKTEEELTPLFASKGWVSQMSMHSAAPRPLGGRRKMM